MVAVLLALLAAQDPREVSVPWKHESLVPRPSVRNILLYQNLARKAGGGRESDQALRSALDWLGRHQDPDGSWDGSIETTGLALNAFLNAGFTTWPQADGRVPYGPRAVTPACSPAALRQVESHARVVRRAVAFLVRSQDASGFIGSRESSEGLRAHAIAARALAEAYGWTLLLILREPAEKALDALLKEPIPADDVLIAWWALALRSARLNGIPYPRALEDQLHLKRRPPGPFSLRRAGIEMLVWNRSRKGESDPDPEELRSRIRVDEIDPEECFWMSSGALRYDGIGGPVWKLWYPPLLKTLLLQQERDPEELRGSWKPHGGGSRAMATAFHALSLAAPYEMPVFWAR
jgi:hypothetical protein